MTTVLYVTGNPKTRRQDKIMVENQVQTLIITLYVTNEDKQTLKERTVMLDFVNGVGTLSNGKDSVEIDAVSASLLINIADTVPELHKLFKENGMEDQPYNQTPKETLQ